MKKTIVIMMILTAAVLSARAQTGFPFDNEIREFKQKDSVKFPPKNGVLFIGSSSIRKWTDLQQRFATQPIIRRGVGGCTLEQVVTYFTPYILFPYQPRKIFIYAGENDIASGKTGDFVATEFVKLWRMIATGLPHAEVYFMSVKPSPSRAKFFAEVEIANTRIKAFLADKKRGHYVDVASVILSPVTMKPDSTLFEKDMLHLNTMGYDKWQAALQGYLK